MTLTTVNPALLDTQAQYTGFKNRIINGAMVIDQRNAGASGTSNTYTIDRWLFNANLTTKGTWQQNAGAVTPPTGFINYWGFTSNSAYSVASGDNFNLLQKVEGFNCSDLGWGTANAQTVTLSFWVRSSLTGTFGGSFTNSANNRSYPFTYTINAANTWEQKSITIAGDTSGTWLTTNGTGIHLWFGLGVGSTLVGSAGSWSGNFYVSATGATSVVGTSGATFYITGVQLEKGSTATSFDYRPYGTELALCQRYFEKSYNQETVPGVASFTPGFASSVSSSNAPTQANGCTFKVFKRASPTVVTFNAVTGASGTSYRVSDGVSVATTLTNAGQNGIGYIDVPSSANGYYWHFTATAEL